MPRRSFDYLSSYAISAFGVAISLVGDPAIRPGVRTTSALDAEKSRYGRFFLSDGRLTGALLINRPAEAAAVVRLIQGGRELMVSEAQLADPGFDIASIGR